MTSSQIKNAYAGKPIYPCIESKKQGDNSIKVTTWLRMKHTDGRWYLCLFIKSFLNAEPDYIYKIIGFEVERMRLFGVVAPKFLLPEHLHQGQQREMFPLDECQLSNEAIWYMTDFLCFPKSEAPDPLTMRMPYGPEFMMLWLQHFAKGCPEPNY